MAKYRKVDPRIWNDEKFQSLPPADKLLAVYCLTAQANRIGIFKFSVALASEDLGMPADEVRERLDRVCHTLFWPLDAIRRVLYFPTWWKYNNPGSPKTLIGILSDVHDVPQTPLLEEFKRNTKHLSDSLSDTLSSFFAKGMASQEQEQEQEQEYITTNVVSAAPSAAPSATPLVPSKHTFEVKASKGSRSLTWKLPQAELDRYLEIYGKDQDVDAELAKASMWLHANPTRRKTAGGMLAYLTQWLNRAANGFSSGRGPNQTGVRRGPEMDPAKANATYNAGG
jgi:hypothetical protein